MNKEPLNILLADDDEADRLLFIEAFEELKIKTSIKTVNDGVELMDFLSAEMQSLPDLVFLDLNMPRKNGLECLKEIKENVKLKDIAIAIYSTSSANKDIDETFHRGANVYIKKPNDFNTLKRVLDKAVKMAHMYQETHFERNNFVLFLE